MTNNNWTGFMLKIAGAIIAIIFGALSWYFVIDRENITTGVRGLEVKQATFERNLHDFEIQGNIRWEYQVDVNERILRKLGIPPEDWPKPPRGLD